VTMLTTNAITFAGTDWHVSVLSDSVVIRVRAFSENGMLEAQEALDQISDPHEWAGHILGEDDEGYDVWLFEPL